MRYFTLFLIPVGFMVGGNAFAADPPSGDTPSDPNPNTLRCTAHHCPDAGDRVIEKRRCEADEVGGEYLWGNPDYQAEEGNKRARSFQGWFCKIPEDKKLEWVNCRAGETDVSPSMTGNGTWDNIFEAMTPEAIDETRNVYGANACDVMVPRHRSGGGVSKAYSDGGDAATLAAAKAYTDQRGEEYLKALADEAKVRADADAAQAQALADAKEAIGATIWNLDSDGDGVVDCADVDGDHVCDEKSLPEQMGVLKQTLDTDHNALITIARRPRGKYGFGMSGAFFGQNAYHADDNLLRGGAAPGIDFWMYGGVRYHNGLEADGVFQYARLSEMVDSEDGSSTKGRGANYMMVGPEILWWGFTPSQVVGFGGHAEGFYHGTAFIPGLGNGVEAGGATFGPTLSVDLAPKAKDVHIEWRTRLLVGFESAGAVIDDVSDVHGGPVGGLTSGLSVVF
jgi:hypothetical protein